MTSITDSAMLVRLSVHNWTARKKDHSVTQEVADAHGNDREMGSYTKSLVGKGRLARLNSAVTALRAFHTINTLPWLYDGLNILTSANYFDYMTQYAPLRDELMAAKREFVDALEAHKADARLRLNGLYRDDDYPSERDLDRRIGVELDVMPMPSAADFRVNLGVDEEQRIRAQIEAAQQNAVKAATTELWQRVHDTVADMAERLARFERGIDAETGKPVVLRTFRDSVVENLRQMTSLMGKLNVAGDANLDAMRQRLAEKLCAEEPATLRDDDTKRAAAVAECNAILEAMSGYIGIDSTGI